MKVLYDHLIFENQKYGGISKYFYEIISKLNAQPDYEWLLPLRYSSNEYISKLENITLKGGSEFYDDFCFGLDFKGKWFLFQYLNKYISKVSENRRMAESVLSDGSYDIFHPTDISPYYLDYLNKKPFVLTVHDLIEEIFPEYTFHVYSNYQYKIKEVLYKKAQKLIAVSEATKCDLVKFYKVPQDKIHVIYHGISTKKKTEKERKRIAEVMDLPDKFILYVGKRVHYKNFYFFIQAIKELLIGDESLKVVCLGSPFNLKESSYFRDLGLVNKILFRFCSEGDLSGVYQSASMLAYPSLYEGFGIPIIEAFQCGCPVVLSNTSALPEVAGDAGMYFDPKDSKSILKVVKSILYDQTLSNKLIRTGLERANAYSWEKTALKTLDVYREVC